MKWALLACLSLSAGCSEHVDLGTNARGDESAVSDAAVDAAVADSNKKDTIVDVPADASSEVAIDAGADVPPCVPPTFAGLASIDDITGTSVTLHWASATHPTATAAEIVYEIFVAMTPVDPFAKPVAAVTLPGATDFVLDGLAGSRPYGFGVRAKAPGGCVDANVVVQNATTLQDCRFAVIIQPIFDRNCAVAGCHVLPTPPEGMVLSSGFAYSHIVGVASVEDPSMNRVTPSDSENSYLYRKMTGRPAAGTNIMPPPGATTLPTSEEISAIKCWIDRGAAP